MGLMQFYETYRIHFQEMEEIFFDHAFSVLEFVWLLALLYVLFNVDISTLGLISIALFIAYHVFGWSVAAMSLRKVADEEEADMIIPLWYFKTCMVWSLLFALVSLLALIQR